MAHLHDVNSDRKQRGYKLTSRVECSTALVLYTTEKTAKLPLRVDGADPPPRTSARGPILLPAKVVAVTSQNKVVDRLKHLACPIIVKEKEGTVLIHYPRPRVCERLAGEPKDACQQAVATTASPHWAECLGCPLERVEAEKPDREDVPPTAMGSAGSELVLETLHE